ncbi:MAG: DnaJ domain-containing protein [Chloroflexaceae bacterium]|nr:DnaJ domain-containing protein [Chloroflexaceae bacterium]
MTQPRNCRTGNAGPPSFVRLGHFRRLPVPDLDDLRAGLRRKPMFQQSLRAEELRLLAYESCERLCNPYYTVLGTPSGPRFRHASAATIRDRLAERVGYNLLPQTKVDYLIAWAILAFPENNTRLLFLPNELLSEALKAIQFSPAVRLHRQRSQRQAEIERFASLPPRVREALRCFGFELIASQSLSAEEIKRVYRQLAKKYHPDCSGDSASFRYLNDCYENFKRTFLIDSKKRSKIPLGRYSRSARALPYWGGVFSRDRRRSNWPVVGSGVIAVAPMPRMESVTAFISGARGCPRWAESRSSTKRAWAMSKKKYPKLGLGSAPRIGSKLGFLVREVPDSSTSVRGLPRVTSKEFSSSQP